METPLQEARIVSKLQHPNIVTLFDAGKHKGGPYLVYAYIEGQTLAQLLKKEKTLSLTRAAQITSGILDGIGYAHQQGVMHLDIKPANIIRIDADMEQANAMQVSQKQLSLLRTLRNQAVLAIKQKM